MDRTAQRVSGPVGLTWVVAVAAVVSSALYLVSDLVESAQGGFSTPQLLMTYVAEAAIPLFVIGLYAVQRPAIGRLGLLGAVAYAYAYVYFTGTVLVALVSGTSSWSALEQQLGVWVTLHGAIMVAAGVAFGVAVVRAGVLPRWTAYVLMAGVVLVAASSGLPSAFQTASAAIRDLGFAGMGACLLVPRGVRRHDRGDQPTEPAGATTVAVPRGTGSAVDLYWLPLGAGEGNGIVRLSGRVYESWSARRAGRPRQRLFHSALSVMVDGERFVVEMTPAWGNKNQDRGVVAQGAVGLRQLGSFALFRYQVRRWLDGSIPDITEAVHSPLRLSADRDRSRRLLEAVPLFPTATWGLDELGTGEMWNSNSLTAWLLAVSGHDTSHATPPAGGRAPGWRAGLAVAATGGALVGWQERAPVPSDQARGTR